VKMVYIHTIILRPALLSSTNVSEPVLESDLLQVTGNGSGDTTRNN
jgi:hypothetical protein